MRITDALRGEHGVFYAQFDRLERELPHTTSVGEIREQAALLAAGLVSHAHLEDEVLFHRLAKAGSDPSLLAAMEYDHGQISSLLSAAQGTHDVELARTSLLEAIVLARAHFMKEEHLAFPLAESALSTQELVALGTEWSERRYVFVAAESLA